MSDLEVDWEQDAINLKEKLAKVTAERDVWLNCFKLTEPETEKLKAELDKLSAEKAALETGIKLVSAMLEDERKAKAALERERDELRRVAYMTDQDGEPDDTLWSTEAKVWYKHAVKVTGERDALKAQLDQTITERDNARQQARAVRDTYESLLPKAVECDRLKAQLAEAREDKKRLDWLQGNSSEVTRSVARPGWWYCWRTKTHFETLREAIDAALAQEQA